MPRRVLSSTVDPAARLAEKLVAAEGETAVDPHLLKAGQQGTEFRPRLAAEGLEILARHRQVQFLPAGGEADVAPEPGGDIVPALAGRLGQGELQMGNDRRHAVPIEAFRKRRLVKRFADGRRGGPLGKPPGLTRFLKPET